MSNGEIAERLFVSGATVKTHVPHVLTKLEVRDRMQGGDPRLPRRCGGIVRAVTQRRPAVHRALLALEPDADRAAPGGAVTLALCGAWQHEPPCPLAPHHTGVTGPDDALAVRVLFAAAPGDAAEVRRRIDAALAAGEATGPGGAVSRWRLLDAGPDAVRDDERDHAGRPAGQAD